MRRQILLLLTFLMISTSFITVHGNTKLENSREQGYSDGYNLGETAGAIYGQKDRINNKKSDWEKAYDSEEEDIEETYDLEDAPRNYRRGFEDGFEDGFQDGYKDAYEGAVAAVKMTAEEIGQQHGEFFGRLMGSKQGKNNFYTGLTSNWMRDLPSDGTIIREFNLSYDTKEYSEAFLTGYKTGYEEEYLFAYRSSNYDNERITRENGMIHGKEIGEKAGEAAAMMDYVQGKMNQWSRALREFENQENLMSRYQLFRENEAYRLGFIAGFKDGFKVGYTFTYQDFNKAMGEKNINYSKITIQGGSLYFEDTTVNFTHGSKASENRKAVELTIPTAAIYEESYITLQEASESYDHVTYIPVSKAYEIKPMNNSNTISLKKPITLSFEYAGPHRAGIYQWKDNRWEYLYSKIEDGKIVTEIDASLYSGGKYAVFIDENYLELKDIYTHWARQELYTFVRRGNINGYADRTFKPDQSISRGEFVALLNRILRLTNTDANQVLKEFKDKDTFGGYQQVISNAVSQGYINGYPDNTFKPHAHITYQEIEWLMQRVLNNSYFRWENIADKMMYERYTRSESRFGKNGRITRAEVVYMLHELL